MTFTLRPYQQEALADIGRRFGQGDVRVPIVLATGLGKTQIFTSLVDRWLAEHPGQRALVIAHTDELINQAVKRMRAVAPGRRVGVVKAGQDEVLAEIIVSSRQTLASAKRRARINRVGLIVIDECHHATRHNTYGKILEHFGAFDDPSPVLVLGVTATLSRSDKQKLSGVWQECTFSRDILFGIRHGFLLDVRGEKITVPDLDLSKVRVRAGDYSDADLGDELERTFAPEVIAKEYARLASLKPENCTGPWSTVRRGLAFWPLVHTAELGRDAFNVEGIRSATVAGETNKRERRELLQRFALPLAHSEAIDVMHNAMVLTEGFDEPTADVVVIVRPTRSAGLYQQMVGRVLRPDLTVPPEQREKALILDVHGSGQEHGLRSLIDLSPERPLKYNPDDEDASLLELDEYLEAAMEDLEEQRAGSGMIVESEEYRGPVKTETFDPLGRDKVWGRTPAGHFYISAGNAYVFLAPSLAEDAEPGTYDVVMCSPAAYVRDGVTPWVKGSEHTGLPLEMALNWGEDLAVQVGGRGTQSLTSRKSKWRGGAPTQAQLKFAHQLKIDGVRQTFNEIKNAAGQVIERRDFYETTLSKGEVSEAIDTIQAARRIDPIVAVVTARAAAQR